MAGRKAPESSSLWRMDDGDWRSETKSTGSILWLVMSSKITADGDCSREMKRRLLLGRKVITNLDSIFKSRDITLPTNVHLVQAMVFPVVMYGYQSWTIKKAERRRIGAFEPWGWRKRLRVPWTAKRSNQSILKEISPEYSLEGLILKLKVQYFGHLMGRTVSFEKTLAGKDWRQEEKGTTEDEMVDGITNSMDMSLSKLLEMAMDRGGLVCYSPWGRKESAMTERLNWTELMRFYLEADVCHVYGICWAKFHIINKHLTIKICLKWLVHVNVWQKPPQYCKVINLQLK